MKITPSPVSLNSLRFVTFKDKITRVQQKSQVLLSSLPPTEDAAELHIKRVFLQIQIWLGFKLNPLEWGWELNGANGYKPIFMSQEPLPDDLKKIMFCSCTTSCGKACGCRKAGLRCTVACKNCCGNDCDNCDPSGSNSLENDDEADIDNVDFVDNQDEIDFSNNLDLNDVTVNECDLSNVVFDENLEGDDDDELNDESINE